MTSPKSTLQGDDERVSTTGRGRLSWHRLMMSAFVAFATLGVLIVILLVVVAIRFDSFGRDVADHVLANAIRPTGREMPVTAGALTYASGDIQIVGGMGKGLNCSLPWPTEDLAFPIKGTQAPIGLKMRQACAYHDYCYRHGAATYGYTQADCDFALQVQAFRICSFIEKERKPQADSRQQDTECMRDARLITLGVRVGGSDSFRSLDASTVPTVTEADLGGGEDNSSTYFEFDPYPAKVETYTVFRIADAPLVAGKPRGTKAIYRFSIRPSGTRIAYSVGFAPFEPYTELPGHPDYITAPPHAIHAGASESEADWFVWWQRMGSDQTTGRLVAFAPGQAEIRDLRCLSWPPQGCEPEPANLVVALIGKATVGNPRDPQIDQLLPADLGPAAIEGLSLATLRHHSCYYGKGNAPCYLHAMIKTDKSTGLFQPQEPLSVNDRISRKPASTDHDRYRNFAALPFVLDPPGTEAPVIAWTRRDHETKDYRSNARLRRAAVAFGKDGKRNTVDDTSQSWGTVFLSGFAEEDEPAFMLGRSSKHPVLASLTDSIVRTSGTPLVMRLWKLPQPDEGDTAPELPMTHADACHLSLDDTWLLRPAQILRRPDGSSLAVFSRLEPHVTAQSMVAKLHLAAMPISAVGACPFPEPKRAEIIIKTASPGPNDKANPLELGRKTFVRISRAPLLLADLDGDGQIDVTFAESEVPDQPRKLCSLVDDGSCVIPPSSTAR